jgi:F420H(2)-dependent quinone reductase
MSAPMSAKSTRRAPLPPRFVVRSAWVIHRAIFALTRGRLGLRGQTATQWGMMRLKTIGRRSGKERHVILGYFEDGPNLVTMAMNGWGDAEPAWWLNLQANPETTVVLTAGQRPVRGRAATPEERPRLWARWAEYDGEEQLESWASRRSRQKAVVILEPSRQPWIKQGDCRLFAFRQTTPAARSTITASRPVGAPERTSSSGLRKRLRRCRRRL